MILKNPCGEQIEWNERDLKNKFRKKTKILFFCVFAFSLKYSRSIHNVKIVLFKSKGGL